MLGKTAIQTISVPTEKGKTMAKITKPNNRRKSYLYACTNCLGEFYFCGTDCNYSFCPRCGVMFWMEDEIDLDYGAEG